MRNTALTKDELRRVDMLVSVYLQKMDIVSVFMAQVLAALRESRPLQRHVYLIKSRIKDPEHLRDKLIRKAREDKEKGTHFDITHDNLLVRITDLAGIRILHLHTRQITEIDKALREVFHECKYKLIGAPFARAWDDESRTFFNSVGIRTERSPRLYTSVHYMIGSVSRRSVTCEIQVRTLMEEVWGEVDHAINYPHQADRAACREQIKVLARVISSASRLVDSIFLTNQESTKKKRQ